MIHTLESDQKGYVKEFNYKFEWTSLVIQSKQSNIPVQPHTIASKFRSLREYSSSKSPLTNLTTITLRWLTSNYNFIQHSISLLSRVETEITMPHCHLSPYCRFITTLNSSSFYPFLHLSLYFCSNFKDHPIQLNRLVMCFFFKLVPLNRFFSQSENVEYAELLHISSSIFLIQCCMETFVITCDYQSHHCRKDYLLYKANFDKNAL